MAEVKMNGLAKKFLKAMQDWIDKRIPEKTRDCLRTKIAIVIKADETNKVYDVILAGDYGTYLNLKDMYEAGELSQTDYEKEVSMLTLDDLVTIKSDVKYDVGNYVVIGIVDNKLTNAFILCKSIKKGV